MIELVIVCTTGRASNDIYSITVTSNQRIHFLQQMEGGQHANAWIKHILVL